MSINTDINDALLNDLLFIYTELENDLLKSIAKKSTNYKQEKVHEILNLKQEAEVLLQTSGKSAKSYISKNILSAYMNGLNSTEETVGEKKTVLNELNVPAHLQNLLLVNNNLINDTHSRILRNVQDAYRDIQSQAAVGMLAGVDSYGSAAQKALNKYAIQGITGFTDKAGRKWDMSTYIEMCLRTNTAHAAIQGQLDAQTRLGFDLVKVSTIGVTCPICSKFQGVILSISGNTVGYMTVDQARNSGLFHPNCKHALILYDPLMDENGAVSKELQQETEENAQRYQEIQKQRYIERQARQQKRLESVAITQEEKKKAKLKRAYYVNMYYDYCKEKNLKPYTNRLGLNSAKTNIEYQNTYTYGNNLKELIIKAKKLKNEVGETQEVQKKKPKEKKEAPKGYSPQSIDKMINYIDNVLEKQKASKNFAHIKEEADAWIATLTADEKYAIKRYTGNAYRSINGYLRTDKKFIPKYENDNKVVWDETRQFVKNLSSALQKTTTTEDIVLRRGTGIVALAVMLKGQNKEFLKQKSQKDFYENIDKPVLRKEVLKEVKNVNKKNPIVYDKGFLSTSYNNIFNNEVEMRILVPKGSKAGYVKSLSNFASEEETILPANTLMKVLKINTDSSSKKLIAYLEVVPKEGIEK